MSESCNQPSPPGPVPPAFPPSHAPASPTPWAGQAPGPVNSYPHTQPPPAGPVGGGGGRGRGRRRGFVVLAVVVVAAVGGGGAYVLVSDDDGDGGSVVARSDLELEDLRPALLTEDDLGGDWESLGASNNVGVPAEWDMSEECRRTLRQIGMDPSEQVPAVQDNFQEGARDEGATLLHNLTLVDEGAPSLADMGDAMDPCGDMTYDDGEWIMSLALDPVDDADGPGDEVLAYEIEVGMAHLGDLGAGDATLFHGYGLVSRRDGVESTITGFGAFPDGSSDDDMVETDSPDVDLVHELTDLADEKLTDVVGG